jgi:hypothetical protein
MRRMRVQTDVLAVYDAVDFHTVSSIDLGLRNTQATSHDFPLVDSSCTSMRHTRTHTHTHTYLVRVLQVLTVLCAGLHVVDLFR